MSKNNKTEADAAVLNFGDEFKGAHALLNAEVLLLIEAYEKGRQTDPTLPYAGPNPYYISYTILILTNTNKHITILECYKR